jgi:hypothetical protein
MSTDLSHLEAGGEAEDDASFVLHEADLSVKKCTAGGCCTWLVDHEKDTTYALARLPALYIVTWFTICAVIGPTYFPGFVRTVIYMYFGYALPRLVLILSCALFGGLRCIKRNNDTDSTIFIHQVPKDAPVKFTGVTHVVVCCLYTEPIEKIAQTMDTLSAQMEVSKQIIICVATEARDRNGLRTAKELRRRYGAKFGGFYITQHTMKEGEVAGKSSNENWAARCMKRRLVDELKYDLDTIVITVCDADTFFHRQHFAELTYRFCTEAKRYRTFWQTPVVHYGNLFDLPLLCQARYAMISVAHLGISSAPWFRGLPFSTYALSMRLAVRAALRPLTPHRGSPRY